MLVIFSYPVRYHVTRPLSLSTELCTIELYVEQGKGHERILVSLLDTPCCAAHEIYEIFSRAYESKRRWHVIVFALFPFESSFCRSWRQSSMLFTYSEKWNGMHTAISQKHAVIEENSFSSTFSFALLSYRLMHYRVRHVVKVKCYKNNTLRYFLEFIGLYVHRTSFGAYGHAKRNSSKSKLHYQGTESTTKVTDTISQVPSAIDSVSRLTLYKLGFPSRATLEKIINLFHVHGHKCIMDGQFDEKFRLNTKILMSHLRNKCNGSRAIVNIANSDMHRDPYVLKMKILNNFQQCLRCLTFNFRYFSKMDPTKTVEVETVTSNEDVIEMELNYNSEGMSDGEVQAELVSLQEAQKAESDDMNTTVIECTATSATALATPKLKSVVVIPETSFRSDALFEKPPSAISKNETKETKVNRNRNRNGSTKRKTGKRVVDSSAGSLVSMLSKVTVSNSISKAVTSTPNNTKRGRSTGSTPEVEKLQPNKIVKIHGPKAPPAVEGQEIPESKSYSMVVRRTLNLKICIAQRPPAGKDLQNIKQFLQSRIEDALTDRASFLPIFKDVCKIERDGVYVFCSDFRCAEWITNIVKGGIPSINEPLTVLPQDTPLKFNPELVMVRVVSNIPTKKPKDKILDILAQMNKDLNTSKWHIRNIRPKGSTTSTVHMRMDKKSFETIKAQNNNVNWILGPITIKLEEHRSKSKLTNVSSVTNLVAATAGNSVPGELHLKPPSNGSVDGIPKGPGLTRNGGSGPKGHKKPH